MRICAYCGTEPATGRTGGGWLICDRCWESGEDGFVPLEPTEEEPAKDCHIPGCTRHWTERNREEQV